MSLKTYREGTDLEDAIRCAHCDGFNTFPVESVHLAPVSPLIHKDSVWSRPCGYLGCEHCPGFTMVHLMFHKGSTFIHTIALKGDRR